MPGSYLVAPRAGLGPLLRCRVQLQNKVLTAAAVIAHRIGACRMLPLDHKLLDISVEKRVVVTKLAVAGLKMQSGNT